MRSFEYFAPTRVIFGKDSHLQIGDILKEEGCHKVLIHYGGHSAISSGLLDEIKKCLENAGADNLEVTNPEREIVFMSEGTKYKIVLSAPRK